MKRIPILACTLCAACAMSSCAVETTYIGKTYPVTDNPELFFSWNDVPGSYETMGRIIATPQPFSDLEEAQKAIEKCAREKGDDRAYRKERRRQQHPHRHDPAQRHGYEPARSDLHQIPAIIP